MWLEGSSIISTVWEGGAKTTREKKTQKEPREENYTHLALSLYFLLWWINALHSRNSSPSQSGFALSLSLSFLIKAGLSLIPSRCLTSTISNSCFSKLFLSFFLASWDLALINKYVYLCTITISDGANQKPLLLKIGKAEKRPQEQQWALTGCRFPVTWSSIKQPGDCQRCTESRFTIEKKGNSAACRNGVDEGAYWEQLSGLGALYKKNWCVKGREEDKDKGQTAEGPQGHNELS